MKAILLLVTFSITLITADWKSLGVACEPLDTTYAFKATATQKLNFRAGPGTGFAVMGFVPQGDQVTVLGWVNCGWGHADRAELWVRADYGGKRGWLCAYNDEGRLLERDGGPLFSIKILKPNPRGPENEDLDVAAGETVEFISDQNPYHYICQGSLLVKRGSAVGYVYRHNFEWGELEDVSEDIVSKLQQEELLEYPSGFWELNLSESFKQYSFDYVAPEGNRNTLFFSGPGVEYPELDLMENGSVLFVEGKWALVQVFPSWGWTYIGDETDPKIRAYATIAELKAPHPDEDKLKTVLGGVPGMVISKDIWPNTTHLMLECWGPYFYKLIDVMKIKGLKIYQPPESFQALDNVILKPVIDTGWHETVIKKYPITMGSSFDPDKPFRLALTVDYGKWGTYPMDITLGQ